MRQIRNGVFETNSSSVHSICIQKDKNITLPNSIYFYTDEYGWEFDCVNTASYLYTAILSTYDKDEAEEKIKQIKTVLDKHSISYDFEEPLYYNGQYYKLYPKIKDEDIGTNTSNKFVDALIISNLVLKGAGGDFKL